MQRYFVAVIAPDKELVFSDQFVNWKQAMIVRDRVEKFVGSKLPVKVRIVPQETAK